MKANEPIVYVVDDDLTFGEVIQSMFENVGIRVQIFTSGEAFLEVYATSLSGPCCLLLDMRLAGISGLSLLAQLRSKEIRIPVIIMTGFGDVTSAVTAMKSGAIDFLEKPLHRQLVLDRVQHALDRDITRRQAVARQNKVGGRLGTLSDREREVMAYLVTGESSKQIATKLGICVKTAMKHRARVLEKLEVDNMVQLVHLLRPATNDIPAPSRMLVSA